MSDPLKRPRPQSYRNRKPQLLEEPPPWDEDEEEDDPLEAPIAKLTAGAALASGRWNPERHAEASAGGAALNRKRKAHRGGRRAFCQCGQCLTCYNRQRKRESRARRKAAFPEHVQTETAPVS